MISTSKIERALLFAIMAHEGQTRKFTGLPYIVHPIEVMTLVREHAEYTENMLVAAILHDTLEDTETYPEAIIREFGYPVYELVAALTKSPNKGHDRAERVVWELERLRYISPEAQTIKVADILSNTADIMQHDPKFGHRYIKEKYDQIGVLLQADTPLHDICSAHLRDIMNEYGIPW